ncbi:hypothetical protein ACFP1I_27570 [Dyadobacter subterraneus]|uniref:Lipopolysaccharide biosynthesis protein n=1 Tax=Dyadobacter subterraneus TaxID=2773304 RepID=A0ABR9WCC1_9BACT|nr:hypothetical protein [Dyadobacter subterraneus]MBE9463123.1 hypothetical protein [Dyadobacter subterraneus]
MAENPNYENQKLNDKKILLIGVKFYHFTHEVIAKMKHYGADVTFFYERDTSLKFAFAKTFNSDYADKLQENHYQNVLAKVKDTKFDYLLVIRGYMMEPWFVKEIKNSNPGIKTIMYQWDSYSNWECDYRHMISSFDVVKTFDPRDAEELNLPYVPTFSSDEYSNLPEEKPKYDIFYSGGFTYPRYDFLKQIINYSKDNNLKLYSHLAISMKSYLREIAGGNKIDPSLLSFKNLNKEEYLKVFIASNVIIDYTKDNQAGITMRTLDTLMAGKKILTNNTFVSQEPGFRPDQVQFFNPKEFAADQEFVKKEVYFPKLDYSIDKFLANIFN